MEYRCLGRSGVKVSRLCLGTMNFGPQTSEQDGFAVMDRAVELGIAATVLAAGACDVALAADEGRKLDATIRRDSHGIPHILADDFAGLGFGYGYAFAQDNICTIAETYVTVSAERSRYFGPDGSYPAACCPPDSTKALPSDQDVGQNQPVANARR